MNSFQSTTTILGSTGSIGRSTLDVIRKFGRDRFKIVALVAGSDYQTLAAQAIEFEAKFVAIQDDKHLAQLRDLLRGYDVKVGAGVEAIKEVCELASDIVVVAIVGFASLLPAYHSIMSGSRKIIIASKESIVCAGRLLKEWAAKMGSLIVSADSEHNAVFQAFDRQFPSSVESITITASGGPFRGMSRHDLESVDLLQALKHPKWQMGPKITVDCATLFNKGLEVIEAHHLFDVPLDRINVVVHPESILHGMVQYKDGSALAQLSYPDMRTPILHSLCWPERYQGRHAMRSLSLLDVARLNFEPVDDISFPAIKLCREACNLSEQAVLLLNASNEVAVQYFLKRQIKFLDIFKIVDSILRTQTFNTKLIHSVEEVLALEAEFRVKSKEFIHKLIGT
jgi:1-deoxy-D-xylulose-5-phosphate reductoisomerase